MTSEQIGPALLEKEWSASLPEPTPQRKPRRGPALIAAVVAIGLTAVLAVAINGDGRTPGASNAASGGAVPDPSSLLVQQQRTPEEEAAVQVVEEFLSAYAVQDARTAWNLLTPAGQEYNAYERFAEGVSNARNQVYGHWAGTPSREITAHKLKEMVVVNYAGEIGIEGDPLVNSKFTNDFHYNTFIVRQVNGEWRLTMFEPITPNTSFNFPDQSFRYADSSSGGGRATIVGTDKIAAGATKDPVEAYAIFDGAAPVPMDRGDAGLWIYAPPGGFSPGDHTFAAVFFSANGGVGAVETPLTVMASKPGSVPPSR